MMVKASDREIEILDRIAPWLIIDDIEGEPAKLKDDAPDEIKKLYEEWLNM